MAGAFHQELWRRSEEGMDRVNTFFKLKEP
jgi:hypothetical protein